jgi:hypothetical protein
MRRPPTVVFGWIRSIRRPAVTRGSVSSAPRPDAAVLRVILKVKDGAGGDYWWVDCGTCDTAWQVPHYAAEGVG